MTPSTQLISWVQENPLPWLRYDEEAGRLIFTVDNTLLSDYRACAQHFIRLYVEGWRPKNINSGAPERNWALDFGTLFHRMMEHYYKHFRDENFDLNSFAIATASAEWMAMDMNVHLQHKECQAMGGYPGFAGMLIQYATQFKAENEHIRVLATEVAFGKNKEVPLYVFDTPKPQRSSISDLWSPADIYLSGRLDIIADDGYHILPLDHKTMGSFRGDPLVRFINDDGPTGYIYALNTILPSIVPPEFILKRECNQISMNLISKAVPKEGSRFKRLPIRKSTAQLEAYRQRTVNTCNRLLADLDSYVRALGVPRDTSHCSNWYFKTCYYADVCRQSDKDGEEATLKNGFIKLPIWDTEAVQGVED
jgi:PD-(D/E)XK nuclease superfamily